MPDFGLLTMSETMDRVRHVVNAVTVPVVADMDTGYGNPLNVQRTVREVIAAGAAGIILEDQEWPKKCGHFEGKRVIPADDHAAKLRAAIDARDGDDLVIIARTDARAPLGLDEAIERGKMYRDAGADVVFVEAPQSIEDLKAVKAAIPDVPLFANMIEGGKTPLLTYQELQDLGYKMVVFPAQRPARGGKGDRGRVRRAVREEDDGWSRRPPDAVPRIREDRRRAGAARGRGEVRSGVTTGTWKFLLPALVLEVQPGGHVLHDHEDVAAAAHAAAHAEPRALERSLGAHVPVERLQIDPAESRRAEDMLHERADGVAAEALAPARRVRRW